jgi:hypothetical protein
MSVGGSEREVTSASAATGSVASTTCCIRITSILGSGVRSLSGAAQGGRELCTQVSARQALLDGSGALRDARNRAGRTDKLNNSDKEKKSPLLSK